MLVTATALNETNATNSGVRSAKRAAEVKPILRLIRDGCPQNAAFGTALSNAILQRVAAGELPETGRLGRPGRIVTFGRRDAVSPGYAEAVAAARSGGYEVVQRLAGGRAAAYNGQALNLSRAHRDPSPAGATRARFDEMAELVRDALESLGVDARIGEVPGEYCPGAYSVNARGRVKLAGIGQRLIKGGAHVGCVIVAGASAELRAALIPVYDALGIEWDPKTAGSVEDEAPGVTVADAEEALLAALRDHFELVGAGLDEETTALAARLQPRHQVDGKA
jgi:octanoyl-[GcvH]:protein N-octanoyltransferase